MYLYIYTIYNCIELYTWSITVYSDLASDWQKPSDPRYSSRDRLDRLLGPGGSRVERVERVERGSWENFYLSIYHNDVICVSSFWGSASFFPDI